MKQNKKKVPKNQNIHKNLNKFHLMHVFLPQPKKQLHNKQKLNEILLRNLNNFGFDGKKINPKIKETVKLESIK